MSTKTVTTATVLCDYPEDHAGERLADRTIRFGVDRKEWETDACDGHARHMERVLGPFIEAARPGRPGPKRDRSVATELRLRDIREWARGQGMAVKDKGRIAGGIVARYEAEHGAGR